MKLGLSDGLLVEVISGRREREPAQEAGAGVEEQAELKPFLRLCRDLGAYFSGDHQLPDMMMMSIIFNRIAEVVVALHDFRLFHRDPLPNRIQPSLVGSIGHRGDAERSL